MKKNPPTASPNAASRMGKSLAAEIVQALAEQAVIVPGTQAATIVIPYSPIASLRSEPHTCEKRRNTPLLKPKRPNNCSGGQGIECKGAVLHFELVKVAALRNRPS
ncbi:hypothetical protein QFZ89_008081 [Paraburkholderia youngii]